MNSAEFRTIPAGIVGSYQKDGKMFLCWAEVRRGCDNSIASYIKMLNHLGEMGKMGKMVI